MLLLTSEQIESITQSSYFHIAHYHELGNDDVSYWVDRMKRTKEQARDALKQLILDQQEKETANLDRIFQGSCNLQDLKTLGFEEYSAAKFCSIFNRGKYGATIPERLQALNELVSSELPNRGEAKATNAMTKVAEVVGKCFDDKIETGFTFPSLSEEAQFISGLNSIASALYTEAGKPEYEGMMRKAFYAAVRKLNSATNHYISRYKIRLTKERKAEENFENLLANIEKFIQEKGTRDWKKKYQSMDAFDEVKTVIQRSAQGYVRQAEGVAYERRSADFLLEQIHSIFDGTTVKISNKKAEVVGGKTDKITKTQQKADILLTFVMESTEKSKDTFKLSFSVKKNEVDATEIQIHNGGSLFSYASRFNLMNFGNVDFDFLVVDENSCSIRRDAGNFQYVFVNELMENGAQDMKEGFMDLLRGAGFLFLGEEVGKQPGADFLFIRGKIHAFSEVLQRILGDESLLNVRIDVSSKKKPRSEKRDLMRRIRPPPFYSTKFIEGSREAGKSAIYGTSYQIDLMKSAYNL